MRRTITRGVLTLAFATSFALGAPVGAVASAGSAYVESTASGTAVGSPRPTVEALTFTAQGADTAPTPTTHALSSSGLDASTLLGFWVGGGALALAAAAVVVSVTVRRARKDAESAK
ncbi:hypothetical protein HR12_21595 [Microbacterium sp. SUBG005]|nr:hypothetical protein HR12_21595 [Microbacterium sp. SUBG005]